MERSSEKSAPEDTGPKNEISLWLVNDDPAQLLVQKRLLGRFASQVSGFGSALEAVAQANRTGESPPFLVSDINMPNMNGVELARLWHEMHSDARVLLLSASSLSAEVRKAVNELPPESVKALSPYRLGELSHTAKEWFGGESCEPASPAEAKRPYPKSNLSPGQYLDAATMDKLFQLGGEPFLQKALARFIESLNDKVAKIESAAKTNDREALHATSHGLKGSGGILGAAPLMEACDALEQATSPDHAEEPVNELVAAVQSIAQATLAEAQKLLKN